MDSKKGLPLGRSLVKSCRFTGGYSFGIVLQLDYAILGAFMVYLGTILATDISDWISQELLLGWNKLAIFGVLFGMFLVVRLALFLAVGLCCVVMRRRRGKAVDPNGPCAVCQCKPCRCPPECAVLFTGEP